MAETLTDAERDRVEDLRMRLVRARGGLDVVCSMFMAARKRAAEVIALAGLEDLHSPLGGEWVEEAQRDVDSLLSLTDAELLAEYEDEFER